jgi:hypothetical protein
VNIWNINVIYIVLSCTYTVDICIKRLSSSYSTAVYAYRHTVGYMHMVLCNGIEYSYVNFIGYCQNVLLYSSNESS